MAIGVLAKAPASARNQLMQWHLPVRQTRQADTAWSPWVRQTVSIGSVHPAG
jgi:hypothetical protein